MALDDFAFICKSISILGKQAKKERFATKKYIENALIILNQNGHNVNLEITHKYNAKCKAMIKEYKIIIWHKSLVWVGRGKRKVQSHCQYFKYGTQKEVLNKLNEIIDANQIKHFLPTYSLANVVMQRCTQVFATQNININNIENLIEEEAEEETQPQIEETEQ